MAKKILFTVSIFVAILVTVFLGVQCYKAIYNGFFDDDPPYTIKGYYKAEEDIEDGFMDYTDYCKYYYNKSYDKEFEKNKRYSRVNNKKEIDKLCDKVTEFPDYNINMIKGDFSLDDIKEGDYYIYKDYKSTNNRFKLYYYSKDKHILYYLNNS